MTSRPPFSDREKAFIRKNARTMSRGMIAQELGRLYPADNGGYRSWRSVRSFLYRERASIDSVIRVNIPGNIMQSARDSGVTIEEIAEAARKAIIKEYEGEVI